MASDQYDKDKMIEAIETAKGKVTLAAKALGCTRDTIYRYAKKYAGVKAAIDGSRADFDEAILDFAEWKLREAVLAGEQWAVKYVLDKKGHTRGYMEKTSQEHTGKDGGELLIKVVYDDTLPSDSKD